MPPDTTKPSIRTDVMTVSQGEVALSFPEAITADDYDDIVAWLALVQRKLKRMVSDEGASE